MKLYIVLFLSIICIGHSIAEPQNGSVDANGSNDNSRNSNGNRNQSSREAAKCAAIFEDAKTKYELASSSGVQTSIEAAKLRYNQADIMTCRTYSKVAQALGNGLEVSPTSVATVDKRATCVLLAGYTVDYKSCASTANAYNYILGLEKAMQTAQVARVQSNSQKLANEVANKQAAGDGQNAALEASSADNNFKSNLSMEQAYAYGAAVGVLGQQLASWKSGANYVTELCSKGRDDVQMSGAPTGIMAVACTKTAPGISGGGEVVANNAAKGAFTAAAMEFGAKAAAALIAAKKFSTVAKLTDQVAAATPTNTDTSLSNCNLYPTAANCQTDLTRVTDPAFTSGDFSMGEGAGSNNFGAGTTTEDTGVVGDPSTITNDNVADLTSPFDDAKAGCTNNPNSSEASKASCILNPAAAAKTQATGGAAGGGGGGGSGGMGGGGVSLGNDLAGADANANKATDIKAGKGDGKYGAAGGGGFQGIKGAKEDANPFASMFDGKSEGGIEEDRSIASADGGADSGIFQKISKRYSQTISDKRIEPITE